MKPMIAAAVTLVVAGAAAGAEIGYYRQPALHGDRLIFVSEGDLWTATLPGAGAPESAGAIVAHRLTAADGDEAHPCISPDGALVAFAGAYDGNTDVYLMPAEGGAPRRLTFHPGADETVAWAPDGTGVYFRSARSQPLGRTELWKVSLRGGLPERVPIGECTAASFSPAGRRFAFTRWSNEPWSWRGYRGGRAPEIWIGDLGAGAFTALTDDPASDLAPMWLAGRVYFASDRTGMFELYSDVPQGGDLRRHTDFAANAGVPNAIEAYAMVDPSAAAERGGSRIVFSQGGALAIYNTADSSLHRLDVRIASDRIAMRPRFAPVAETLREIALSRDGRTVFIGARGDILAADVGSGAIRPLTRTSSAREWGATPVGDDLLALVTDAGGEQQIAVMPPDGSEAPSLLTEDRETWLAAPVASPRGTWIAFGDATGRLHAIDRRTLERRQLAQSDGDEITDYRFSPDEQWLAWTEPRPNGRSRIWIHALRTGRDFPVTDGRGRDREPRWDPAGRYLYFLSDRHLDAVRGELDTEHVFLETTRVYAVPLATETPPPIADDARAAGFDLRAWARPPAPAGVPAPPPPPPGEVPVDAMHVDTGALALRAHMLPIEPGAYRHLEAQWGSITYLADPVQGLLERRSAAGSGRSALHRHACADGATTTVVTGVDDYALSGDGTTIAYAADAGIVVRPLAGDAPATTIDLGAARLRVDPRAEWSHILAEAWRLQRDFFWAPDMGGVDWPALRWKYEALLDRVGTRAELNDVVGAMVGELGTSHAGVWGGSGHEREEAEPVAVGLLGADLVGIGGAARVEHILRRPSWSDGPRGPLDAAHLPVAEGDVILAVDGQVPGRFGNIYELLQDRAGRFVDLLVADASGTARRTVRVRTIDDESDLRYLAWVESNRQRVAEAAGGAIGYVHVSDTHARGLSMFGRQFYAQYDRPALIIDARNNAGGFGSQMIIERLARTVLGFLQPRHGPTERYPARAPHAHLVLLVDEHTGSDGEVLAAAFRRAGLGPVIGSRTWGGVVGARGDKRFVDLGQSTQPEFAWWEPGDGWTIENAGVAPDVAVATTPADRVAGRDPALEAAIVTLTEALARDPMELPKPPPYP